MLGETVADYRVIEPLGGGGMGKVYKAEDLRLGRPVAIKFLPENLLTSPVLVDRFRREARAASLLNHPNICKIFDIGDYRGQPYLVMELMEGETLDNRLRKGPLPTAELLEIAVQLADGLDAAHRAGILHRDIKPSNIFLTRHGAKLLDFGLAKLPSDVEGDDYARTLTQPGALLGTINYMSPEQALGHKLDARSDLFSFGGVLYEMATRTQPFRGETPAAIFEAILHQQPAPADRLNPQLPPDVAAIIRKALERSRKARYQTAREIRADLRRVLKQSDSTVTTVPMLESPSRPRRGPSKPAVIALAAFCLTIAGLWYALRHFGTWASTSAVPRLSFRQITNDSGPELFPSLSPDGKSLAYAAMSNGRWDIFLRRVDGANPINLTTNTAGGGTQPAFSPDGDRIAFRGEANGGGIFVMGATGEAVRRISGKGYHPAWSPDGKQIVYAERGVIRPDSSSIDGGLWIVNLADGSESRLLAGEATQPSWSPDGARIAYWKRAGANTEIWTVAVKDARRTLVFAAKATSWNPIWSPDGKYLYFPSDRAGSMNLWRIRVSPRSGMPEGAPQAITTPSPYSGHLSFSRDGRRLAYVQHLVSSNIVRYEFAPPGDQLASTALSLTRGSQSFLDPDVSADGRFLVLRHQSAGRRELAVMNADGSGMRTLLDDTVLAGSPAWSPDGEVVAFVSSRDAGRHVWVIAADGSGLRMISAASEPDAGMPVWSPSGDRIAYSLPTGEARIVDLQNQTSRSVPAAFVVTSWSPDGKSLAGYSSGIVTYNLETQSTRRVSDYGMFPVWLKDGRRLVFHDGRKIYLADAQSGQVRDIANLGSLSADGRPSVSSDGRSLYLSLTSAEADVWLVSLE